MNAYEAKKTLLSLSLGLFIFGNLIAQNTFFKTFDSSGNDAGNYVINTNDGGYAIVGRTNSLWSGDVWLLKTDANGDTLWTTTYGGDQDDDAYCVRQTSDNGFIIAASKTVPEHYMDGWIIKTDANGNMDWEYNFGGEWNGDCAYFLVPSDNQTFVVSGVLNAKSYVFKIDEDGNIIWEHSYFLNNSSSTAAIYHTSDNGYAVVGSAQLSTGGWWYPNIFLINNMGELLTQITYMESGNANRIIETSDGGFIFGGSWNDSLQVKKISSTGIDMWEYAYQGEYLSTITSINETSDGNIIITDNSENASMRKLNPDGDTLWTRHNSFGADFPKYRSVQLTNDNALIITGYGKSDAYDHEVVLVKTDLNGSMTGIANSNWDSNLHFYQNSPNPFNNNTNLSFYLPKTENIELYISDAHGNKISTIFNGKLSSGNHKYVWDGNNAYGIDCPDGIYFATLRTNEGQLITKKLLKSSR